jgi:hypothetical protein
MENLLAFIVEKSLVEMYDIVFFSKSVNVIPIWVHINHGIKLITVIFEKGLCGDVAAKLKNAVCVRWDYQYSDFFVHKMFFFS